MRLTIDAFSHEWDRVARFAAALPPEAFAGHAVWLRSDGETRRWVGHRAEASWLIIGEPDDRIYEIGLPTEAVWFGAELAGEDGACRVEVASDGLVVLRSGSARAVFDPPLLSPPSVAPWPTVGTRATMDAGDLHHLVAAACRSSNGRSSEAPIWLAAGGTELTASASDTQQPRSSYSRAAVVEGRATLALARHPMHSVLSALVPADGPDITLDFPDHPAGPLGIRGDGWGALLNSLDQSVLRWASDLEGELAELQVPVLSAGGGVFHVRVDGTLVRASLHSGPPDLVRLSTVVLREATPTAEVWAQLNDANRSLAGTSVWIEDGEIVASAEVECDQMRGLAGRIRAFTDQLDGFGVFISALT